MGAPSTGDDVLSLADIVGGEGRAIGYDLSEQIVAEGQTRTAGRGGHIAIDQADIAALPRP